MTTPRCPKCDNSTFQTTVTSPEGSKYKIALVHCSSCGCVVGNTPFFNTAKMLEKIAKKLGVDLFD